MSYFASPVAAVTILGDNLTSVFPVGHAFGSRNIAVYVYENTAPYAKIEVGVEHTSSSVVTIIFSSPPTALESFRVIMFG